jgi:predicted metalloprotease with PDZ domain
MAAEMDDRIRSSSGGAKSLRDALRHLLRTPQPFRIEELPARFREGTGVDVGDVLERWLK